MMEDVPAAPERNGAGTLWFNISYERVRARCIPVALAAFQLGCVPGLQQPACLPAVPLALHEPAGDLPTGGLVPHQSGPTPGGDMGALLHLRPLLLTASPKWNGSAHAPAAVLCAGRRWETCHATTAAQRCSCTSPTASGRRASCWRQRRRRPRRRGGPSSACAAAPGGRGWVGLRCRLQALLCGVGCKV